MTRFHVYLGVMCAVVIATLINHAQGEATPNIVFILTDDQDLELGGTIPIKKTRDLIGSQGKVFEQFYVNTPLCCPSRSSILTGKHVHNNMAVNNSLEGNCSSPAWQQTQEVRAFPTYLHRKGYTTFFAGKYLNRYGNKKAGGVQHVPPGWTHWNGLVGNSKYYNYTLSVDGVEEKHGDNYDEDYFTDVINRKATTFLNSAPPTPFFMMLATPSAHAPFTPAPQYRDRFSQVKAPRDGSFNMHGSDKHWLIRQAITPMMNESVQYLDSIYRDRWRTLLSVDDMVENLVDQLTKKGLIDNTYIFFSSDNGYHVGQFSLPSDKRQLYQFDIHVPFMVRGPGITPGTTSQDLVTSIDLAPTFLEIAKIPPPSDMDGLSLLPQLSDTQINAQDRKYLLIEHQGEHTATIPGCPQYDGQNMANCLSACVCEDSLNNTYSCIVGGEEGQFYKYCRLQDDENFEEYYDLLVDVSELRNLAPVIKNNVSLYDHVTRTLSHLVQCAGPSCSRIPEKERPCDVKQTYLNVFTYIFELIQSMFNLY
ncbi:N-acetylglucosamine-6-sulfatase-like isoform X2 [Mizuhopecten yessoensis]|uniref:N-acetylglucosamine-6-sulfatase n=1 Tax=Mizuhopecten yessoensis TaxID=6573 RepID=A0A210R184_MIZYE|nr:N-acetylglucosamine-6-sulfatase-like isoform X2 [Mizuhopecten yessoensis]OWF54742.1 N-acetylglucosamine-6-sulfatase [Mizuhopecten yessoensis]